MPGDKAKEKIRVTIDGREIEVARGATILEAAQHLGIEIPTLCYNKMVKPYTVCRVCVVEMVKDARSRIVTACNFPIMSPMEIHTSNDKVKAQRKAALEKLLAKAPASETIRELATEYSVIETPSTSPDPEEKCIMCGLCVRVCEEVVGAKALCLYEHDGEKEITTETGGESERCIACGACAAVCPTGAITVEDAEGREIVHEEICLAPNTPISVPSLQAVPNVPSIDPEHCIHFLTGGCGHCASICPTDAIDYSQQEEEVNVQVGNIIMATGYDQFEPHEIGQYGYGRYHNVLTALDFERMNCAAGSTEGNIMMTNGKEPESIGIVHCVGSRDRNYFEYCSRVCCMYALKYAHLIKEKTDAEVYNFYIDMRCFGKGYEEFYHRLLDEGVRFVRGKVGEITDYPMTPAEEGKLIVRCEDTLAGAIRRIPVDMVVLCSAIKSREDAKEISRIFSCSLSPDGFFLERHPKLAPVSTNTDGVFIAGCCQAPKDIPDAVAQGTAAAAEVLSLISRGTVEMDAAVAEIDEEKCSGCRICNALCPYSAIEYDEEEKVSRINAALCEGCGTCVAACPRGCIKGKHFTDTQILSEIVGILKEVPSG